MKNTIKKFIATASIAAIALCPAATLASNYSFNASAASLITYAYDPATNSNCITVNQSMITVTRSQYSVANKTLSNLAVSSNKLTGKATNMVSLDKGDITLTVKATSGLTKAKLESMKLYLTFDNINGATGSQRTLEPASVTSLSGNRFQVKYTTVCLGTSFNFTTSALSGVSGLSITEGKFVGDPNSTNYWKIEAKATGGESLYIRIRKGINTSKINAWAKDLCTYVNSLKDVTGVTRGTVYMCFDDPFSSSYAYSANFYVDTTWKKNAYTGFCTDATTNYIASANENTHFINWGVMHELAHSYGCYTEKTNFQYKYGYHDEVFTNVRGLTAIQNCKNLQDMTVIDTTGGTYANIYDKRHPASSDVIFYMGKSLVNLGNQYGFDKLDVFFKAETDYDYNCTENKTAAQKLKSDLGLSISATNTNYLKFVNGLRKVYKLCWNNGNGFDQYAFMSFVNQHFSEVDIPAFVSTQL